MIPSLKEPVLSRGRLCEFCRLGMTWFLLCLQLLVEQIPLRQEKIHLYPVHGGQLQFGLVSAGLFGPETLPWFKNGDWLRAKSPLPVKNTVRRGACPRF